MSKFQPSRSQVPVDERSVLATVPGLPWWGAVLTLLAFTAAGALVSGEITGANAGMYAVSVGAVVAVLAVRNRALFTAMVQPPLVIAAAIPAYRWFSLPSPRKTSDILTEVLFPLVSLFPWMFWISVIVIVIGGARFVLYRQLTATARSVQRTSTKSTPAAKQPARSGAKAAAKAPATGTRSRAAAKEPAGLPIGARIGAALAKLRPGSSAAPAAAGAVGLLADGDGRSERHPSSRPARGRDREATDARTGERGATRRRDSARRDGSRRDDTRRDDVRRDDARRDDPRRDAARGADPRRDDRRREAARADSGRRDLPRNTAERTEAERLARRRAEIAARDASAPATQVNRVVRPDSGPIRPPRPQPPRDEHPHGARPRPAVAEGDRPRPPARDPREYRPDGDRRAVERRDVDRRGIEPQPRWRTREPEAPLDQPQRPAARAEARDYRREAHDIERARGTEPAAPRPDRPRIPRDDFASLPRISGSRAAQPDLPSLTRDGERPARRSAEPPSTTGRYEHYRAPRYRPTSDTAPGEANFRDDFAEPTEQPRQIRRYRYKD